MHRTMSASCDEVACFSTTTYTQHARMSKRKSITTSTRKTYSVSALTTEMCVNSCLSSESTPSCVIVDAGETTKTHKVRQSQSIDGVRCFRSGNATTQMSMCVENKTEFAYILASTLCLHVACQHDPVCIRKTKLIWFFFAFAGTRNMGAKSCALGVLTQTR